MHILMPAIRQLPTTIRQNIRCEQSSSETVTQVVCTVCTVLLAIESSTMRHSVQLGQFIATGHVGAIDAMPVRGVDKGLFE